MIEGVPAARTGTPSIDHVTRLPQARSTPGQEPRMPRVDHRASRPYWVHSDPGTAAASALHPPCPGVCNDPWRAAEHERLTHQTPHALAPIDGNPVWCNA